MIFVGSDRVRVTRASLARGVRRLRGTSGIRSGPRENLSRTFLRRGRRFSKSVLTGFTVARPSLGHEAALARRQRRCATSRARDAPTSHLSRQRHYWKAGENVKKTPKAVVGQFQTNEPR